MAIVETISLRDEVSAAAASAASSVDVLDAALVAASAAADELAWAQKNAATVGVKAVFEASAAYDKAFNKAVSAQAKVNAEAEKAASAVAAAHEKAAKAAADAHEQSADRAANYWRNAAKASGDSWNKSLKRNAWQTKATGAVTRKETRGSTKNIKALDDALGGATKQTGGLGKAMGAFGAKGQQAALVIGVIAGITAGVTALTAALVSNTANAIITRDSYRAMLDQVTKGRGAEALAMLDKVARDLNMSVEDATDQFIKLRKDGLNNLQSEAFIKLRADLLAVGVTADTADEAIKKAIDSVKAGKDANAVIKETAAQFGAVGDGANAAANRALTLGGALKAASGLPERMFARVADAAAPAFTELATTISDALESFEQGDAAAAIIDRIVIAVKAVTKFAGAFIKAVKPGIEAVTEALGRLNARAGGTSRDFSAAESAGNALGSAIGVIATIIGGAIDAFIWLSDAARTVANVAGIVADAISSAVSVIANFVGEFKSAGGDLVKGFISGLEAKIGAVIAAASSLGEAAAGAIKSALGISSPSKVAMALGENFGDSFTDALDSSMPDAVIKGSVANDNAQIKSPDIAPAGGGQISISVTVNVYGSASSGDVALEVERGVINALRQRGL